MKKQTYKTTQPLGQGYFAVEKQKQDPECSTGFFGKEAEVTSMYLDDVHKQMHSGLESYLAKESQYIQGELALAKQEREKRLDAQGLTTPYDFSFLKEEIWLIPRDTEGVSWIKKPIFKEILGWAISGAMLVGITYLGLSALKDIQSAQKPYTPPGVVVERTQMPASKLFDMRTMDYKP